MKLIPNFLNNPAEIVALAKEHNQFFERRVGQNAHESLIPGVLSKFSTLKDDSMSRRLRKAIFANCNFKLMSSMSAFLEDTYKFIQIQKYEPGDYIAPHRDAYDITKLHLISLTTSDHDGLVCENKDHELIFIPDVAGTYIDFPYDAAHYVSPVRSLRYSLVIGE